MTTPTPEQEKMNKRFDERFGHYLKLNGIKSIPSIKSFIQSEIDLAVANREEEIMSGIRELEPKLQGHMAYVVVGRILSLITKV